jgi:hypothetical protein
MNLFTFGLFFRLANLSGVVWAESVFNVLLWMLYAKGLIKDVIVYNVLGINYGAANWDNEWWNFAKKIAIARGNDSSIHDSIVKLLNCTLPASEKAEITNWAIKKRGKLTWSLFIIKRLLENNERWFKRFRNQVFQYWQGNSSGADCLESFPPIPNPRISVVTINSLM